MDITNLVHATDTDVPRIPSLPESPSSVSSSTLTRPTASPTATSLAASIDDDSHRPFHAPAHLPYHHHHHHHLPLKDHFPDAPAARPLPPMLAPLELPPLISPLPISPAAPSPTIRRPRGTRPRPFVCWCGSAFSKREHLKRHDMLVHKALRPYRCDVCQVDFGTKQNMQVHFTTRKHRDREMFMGRI